ncbi:MAG: DUF1326 domain-containing protein [Planctomycetes bacterium]|nr:DUF1326 domain-containing protein [Planctomycetota bacterium]
MRTVSAVLGALLLAGSAFAGFGGDTSRGDDERPRPQPSAPLASMLRGDYLEARTCDVWVGACYANSETSEQGRQATLVWKFSEGAWKGVELKGLGVALVIVAKSTLGDPYHSALPVRNVLLVDARANDEQLRALRDFVATQAGELGGNVIEEIPTSIALKVDCCDKEGCAKFEAGEIAQIETRCLKETDEVCGHEKTFYPPLVTALADKHAVFTVEHKVKGTLLELAWIDRDSRSAFLGKFEIETAVPPRTVGHDEVRAR